MGKRKRSKHKPLTQEEIWDDSALIQSWDEAVQEYEFYHSIHAKGENIEDVLRHAEASESAADTDRAHEGDISPLVSNVDGDVQWDGGGIDEKQPPSIRESEMSHITQATVAATTAPHGQEAAEAASSKMGTNDPGGEFVNMPQMVLGGDTSASSEQLKSLMMSWYFAGYYTGLYEGQQRGNQPH